MTHDELVRFAAEKVGGEVDDGDVMIRSIVEIGDGHVCPVNNFYQLTSPSLMLKGLGILDEEGVGWLLTSCEWEMWKPANDRPLEAKKHIPIIDMHLIPLYFWQCWAELEGGHS